MLIFKQLLFYFNIISGMIILMNNKQSAGTVCSGHPVSVASVPPGLPSVTRLQCHLDHQRSRDRSLLRQLLHPNIHCKASVSTAV